MLLKASRCHKAVNLRNYIDAAEQNLDEPTTWVDAISRKEFWDILQNLKQQGITILVPTPYMDEATFCDRITLMQHGEFLSTGTPAEIIHSFAAPVLAVKSTNMYQL